MPPNHQKVTEWTPDRIVSWAKTVGVNTSILVGTIMATKEHPEQAYRACMGIIRLASRYTPERVEKAAARALSYGATTYRNVLSILEKGLDQVPFELPTTPPPVIHRGINYYSSKEVN